MKKTRVSLFYKVLLCIVVLLLLVFCYVRFFLLRPWLIRYEAAQPKYTSQQVFHDLFSPADWGRVYDLSADLPMNRDSFVYMMEGLTAGQELTLVETSAGLSGDRRYIIKAGSDSVAAFTLANVGQDGETVWELDSVEFLLELSAETVSIRTLAGQRVLIDGLERGESCQVQFTETAAERYLPEGVYGRRTVLWQVPAGSPQQVDVSVLDENGRTVPVTYDEDANCFVVEEPAEEPTDAERAMLLGAAEVHGEYMIRQATAAQLQRYFDSNSQIYQTIRSSEIWIKNTAGHSFENEEIHDFFRYSPDVFSARVTMNMSVRRGNGTIKPYEVNSTFFFHKTNSGWRAYEMTNVDVRAEITHTLLVFMNDQEEIGRLFVSSEDRSFTPPAVTAPQGQRFVGWAVREASGDSVTMTVRFQPGEDGTVSLPESYALEPMTLYAVFE